MKEGRDHVLRTNGIFAAGDRVVSMGNRTGTHAGSGKKLDAAHVHVWTAKFGSIVHMRQMVDTTWVLDARS